MIEIKVNKYQTPITEELLSKYPEEVVEEFFDFMQNVEFIKNLTSADRKYAKDLPRDDKGRIIVNLENPHILEDMDYFRQPAIHFELYGCYTFLKPNNSPYSEYRKFWAEEIRRCLEGYVRESDGEWVTGYCYWFLNYSRMLINKINKNSKKADRIEAFPYFFEGIYWRFHYIDLARNNGKHAIELARRGCGKAHPYSQLVYTPEGLKTWGEVLIGDYLIGDDGNPTKVINIPFDDYCDVYKITLKDGREVYASDNHLWKVIRRHCNPEIQIVSTKEIRDRLFYNRKKSYRNPKGKEFLWGIVGNKGVNCWKEQSVLIDPYTMGLCLGDGCFRTPELLNNIYYTSSEEDMQTYKSIVPYEIIKLKTKQGYFIRIPNAKNKLIEYGLYTHKSEDKFIPYQYKFNTREIRLNLLRGLMDSGGSIDDAGIPYFSSSSKRLADDVEFIARSLGYNCTRFTKPAGYKKEGVYKKCLDSYCVKIYTNERIFNLERKYSLLTTFNSKYSRSNRDYSTIIDIQFSHRERCKCVTVDNSTHCYLIGDFITTHNSFSLSSIMSHNLILGESLEVRKRVITILAAYLKEYLKDDKDGTFSKFRPALNFIQTNTPFPRLMLKNSPNEMSWQMGYKDEYGRDKGSFNSVMGVAIKDDEGKLRGKRGLFLFEEMGSMPNLLTVYDTTRKSVEDGDYTFGQIYLVGTAAEKESDFSSAKTLLYAPQGYNIYAIKNVFDKPNQGKKTFGFFFPAYINRAGCYNENGVSDVVKALLEVLMQRYKAKYSADPKSVLRVIAEDPITPAEAIIKVKAAYFPVSQLNERLLQLDSDVDAYDDVYIGNLVFDKSSKVIFKPSDDEPIRKWGVANDTPGAIEIFEMPEKNNNGDVFSNRYVVGLDPVDNDLADSHSLSSTIVFDLFTDKIVAEFTGRKAFADDNFEITRLLCLFYNAKLLAEANKKGWYAYFAKMNCTHLLMETPEYLREKQLVKYSAFGSNKYGVNATAAINDYANNLIREWLLKPITIHKKDSNNEDIEETIPTLYTIRNRALLEELVNFSPEVNVDRIRSLGMVMLAREEKIILYQGDMSRITNIDNGSELANDSFFKDNYDNKFDMSNEEYY